MQTKGRKSQPEVQEEMNQMCRAEREREREREKERENAK
jgi:hypothetical protein